MKANSFDAHDRLRVGDAAYEVFRLDRVEGSGRLPVQPEGAAGEPAAQRGRQARLR